MKKLSLIFCLAFISSTSQAGLPTKQELNAIYDKAKAKTDQAIEAGKKVINTSKDVAKDSFETGKQWAGQAADATQAGVASIQKFFQGKPKKDYQNIKHYKACFAIKEINEKNMLCLPKYRPYLCPVDSYLQL